ncbi:unnamed protein product [Ectocarpus sp. 12 AP-2014]
MARDELLKRSRRGAAVSARLVRTMPAARASSSSLNPWVARNWGLVVAAVATVATVAFSLGTTASTSRSGAMTGSARVGQQSLYASPKSRGGISVAQARRPSSVRPHGRVLQEETPTVITPIVEYGTKLQIFMCNPSLEVERNDAHLVDQASLAAALSNISGIKQADEGDITVTIKTEPVDVDDVSYMCDTDGMLQWHAQVEYSAAYAGSRDTTPAVLAAQANDYVAYSSSQFKALLAGFINAEYAGEDETVELSVDDILIPTVGWIVTFPAEESVTQETHTAGSSDGLAMGIGSDSSLWAWWVWLIYALLMACCLMPLCCCLRRRRADEKEAARDRLIATRKGRGEEGLAKIRGPEWGITELDFEGDYDAYQSQEMKREYDGAGRGVEPTAYRPSHRAGQQSVSAQAWMQEAGKKSAWAQSSGNSSRQGGGQSPVVRRFDIDDDDADDGVGKLRSKHPQYSFDVGRGGFNDRDGESNS